MCANRTHRERRSSGMTELSALAGSEGYAACDDEASVELAAFGGQPRRRAQRRSPSAAGNPRSAECTSWERRSSEMTELSAKAGSEGYAACDDDGGLHCHKRPSTAFCDSLKRDPSGDSVSVFKARCAVFQSSRRGSGSQSPRRGGRRPPAGRARPLLRRGTGRRG